MKITDDDKELATDVVEIFEDKLKELEVILPADERTEGDNEPLIGYHYAEVLDRVTETLAEHRHKKPKKYRKKPDDIVENNAVITETFLGQTHSVYTAYLHLSMNVGTQSFGGRVMGKPHQSTAFGMAFIIKVLEVTGVKNWEKLPGTPVRVRGNSSKIYAIGNIMEDKWLDIDKLVMDYQREFKK